MPDHEEAVREAAKAVWGQLSSSGRHTGVLEDFESAIRASERAKYAALVEAAENALTLIAHGDYHNGVTDSTGSVDEGEVRAGRIYGYLHAALAALQSKEGTNE